MVAPANELQAAVFVALTGSTEVAALVADRVYDRPPGKGDIAPFITLGDGSEVTDPSDCKVLSDHSVQVNVWSEYQGGMKEVKDIAHQVKLAVQTGVVNLATHALIGLDHIETRYLRDPDGITTRAVLSFDVMIEEN